MDLEKLIATQKAAHAAWMGCPDKSRAKKAALEAALSEATRAVAAAKRAAAPTVDASAAVDAFLARQRENADKAALYRRVQAAHARYVRAHQWPQCGQGWGDSPQDKADMALIEKHGADLCAWEDCV